MRIVIDARYISDHFPGIGRYVYNLVRATSEVNTAHQLLIVHNAAGTNTRYDLNTLVTGPAIKLIETQAQPFSPVEHTAIPILLRRLRADVYHAPYYVRPYAGVPCPSVVTLYDAIPRLFPREVSLRARLLFNALTWLAIRRSNHVITISQSARMDLAGAYGIHPLGISVTPLGVDERFQPQSRDLVAAVRAKYGMPERYVLTLASNKPHKNLPLLIEAWALLDELSPASVLVVAGHWDKRYPEAKEAVARLGLQHRVLFISHMADDDLPALYTGASLFVFPSRYEGFGLPPLEAMACGTPVVCGGVSSLPEVVGDAALTVDITRAEAVAEGIIKVLCDDRLRKAMSIRAKQQAARFSWRSTAEATLQVYERI